MFPLGKLHSCTLSRSVFKEIKNIQSEKWQNTILNLIQNNLILIIIMIVFLWISPLTLFFYIYLLTWGVRYFDIMHELISNTENVIVV